MGNLHHGGDGAGGRVGGGAVSKAGGLGSGAKFTQVELDMLKKSFKDLAQRSPGKTIDKETFLKFFPLPGLHGERLFHLFDNKHTGTIDFEEFLAGMAVCAKGSFEEKVHLIFRIYDIDENQHVSKAELRTMLHQVPKQALSVLCAARGETLDQVNDGQAGGVAMEVVDRLVDDAFSKFDLNKDEKLSKDQFSEWVKNTPEVLNFLDSVFPIDDLTHGATIVQHNKGLSSRRSSVSSVSNSEIVLPLERLETSSVPSSVPPSGLRVQSKLNITSPAESRSSARSTDDLTDANTVASNPNGSSRSRSTKSRLFLLRKGSDKSIVSGHSTEDDLAHHGDHGTTFGYLPDGCLHGMLYKVGRRTKTIRARLFVLRGSVLYYFYPHKLEQPAGIIFLQGCFVAPRNNTQSSVIATTQSSGPPPHSTKSNALPPPDPLMAVRSLRSEFSEVTLTQKRSRPADMDITGCTTSLANAAAHLFAFEIITSQGGERDSRVLYVKTEAQRSAWIEAIRLASKVIPFDSKYRRLEQLGRGKFATVFKCEKIDVINDDKPLEQREYFAVKVIDKSILNEKEKELLRTEIAVLKLVNHPNIIRLEDVFESLNHIYIVLEFVQGGELFDRIVGRARLKENEVYNPLRQLAEAVHYLHVLGVAHRDIKPENILCSGNKTDPITQASIKICDFGLSKLVSPQGVMKLACGTLSYVAPEVLTSKGYGKAADIWNIGVIIYLVRRGKLPFDGETKEDIIHNTVHGKLDFASDPVFSKSSAAHVDLMKGLLNKDPKQRLTAAQVLEHPWMKHMEHLHEASALGADTQTLDTDATTII